MHRFAEIIFSSSAFLVFSLALFAPVEWLLAARQSKERAPFGDWLHFWLNSIVVPAAAVTIIALIGGTIRAWLPASFRDGMAAQPLWAQLLLVVVLAELWSYWAHRLAHTVPFLWRFHRVHHSIEHMTWISALRQHPFDAIWIMAAANVPAFALGVDLRPIAAFILFERCYTVLLHSNLDFSFGWFDHVMSSTRFHHWHHDSGEKERNRNFAGMFSILDTIFGTYHPTEKAPAAFGPADLAPRKYWRQMAWPFVRDRR
jgi:sterol desaturase/sphingolipid hydroxylase (fatty acid hydroxylase superfamily)